MNEFAQQPVEHFEEAIKHSHEVTQQIRDLQIELADKSRQLDGEMREVAELSKRESYLKGRTQTIFQEKTMLEQQLWALYNELHRNLDTGKPQPITPAKIKAETEELKQELASITTENTQTGETFLAEYNPIVDENEKLKQDLQRQILPPDIGEISQANERYKKLIEMSNENKRLEEMNRKMLADRNLLTKAVKFAADPIDPMTQEITQKLVQNLSSTPTSPEFHMTSINCEPMLHAVTQELSKQKQENKQLQDGLHKLQNGVPEEELRDAINKYFQERGQLLDATADFQRKEDEIVKQLGAVMSPLKWTGMLSNGAFTSKSLQDAQIVIQTTPAWASAPRSLLLETQQVHEVLKKLHSGIRKLQEYQQTTMRYIKDEASTLPENLIGQQF